MANIQQTAQFIITIPIAKARKASHILGKIGVHFDPDNAVTATNDTVGRYVNHTGQSVPDLVKQLNSYNNLVDQITMPLSEMTIAEKSAILNFTALECDWDNEYPTPHITHVDHQTWEQFVHENSSLFIRK